MNERPLTKRQLGFALAMAEGATGAEAYRANYNATRFTAESVTRKAYDLLQDVRIRSIVDEARRQAAAFAGLSRARQIERLGELSRAAEAANQFAPAVAAERERNKLSDLYAPQRVELGPSDPLDAIAQRFPGCTLRVSPEGDVVIEAEVGRVPPGFGQGADEVDLTIEVYEDEDDPGALVAHS
jgi:hypothetical protein